MSCKEMSPYDESIVKFGGISMLYIIGYVLIFLLFWGAPFWLQLLFTILNVFINDPIPLIDEAVMGVSVEKKLISFTRIAEFVSKHKILSAIMVIGLLVIVFCFIF